MSVTASTTTAAPPPAEGQGSRARAGRGATRERSGFWFAAPFLVLFGLFMVWPVVAGFVLSFTNESLTGSTGAAGLSNYAEALTDSTVWSSLLNTVEFTVYSTIPLVVIPFVMALLTHLGLPGQWLWRLSFFAPFLLPVTVVSQIFVWILQPDLGLLNDALAVVGIDGGAWLADPSTAMWGIVIATVWWTSGFNYLLFLAGLQNVPAHLYEAAAIDGAGAWRQLVSLTIPLLRTTLMVVLVLQALASLKVFDQIYQMTAGGPADSTQSVLLYVYETGFTGYRLGYAAAISNIFFALIIILSVLQHRALRRRES